MPPSFAICTFILTRAKSNASDGRSKHAPATTKVTVLLRGSRRTIHSSHDTFDHADTVPSHLNKRLTGDDAPSTRFGVASCHFSPSWGPKKIVDRCCTAEGWES